MIDNIVGCDLSSSVFLRFLRNKIIASSNLFYFIFMNSSTLSCIIIVILNYYISCFFEIPALHVASNDILNNDDHECEALIHELSICSFVEFRVFLRFLNNEIASFIQWFFPFMCLKCSYMCYSDCDITKFHVLLRFLHSGVAASNDVFYLLIFMDAKCS